MLTADIKNILRPSEAGITLIITVGNSFRTDDGAGPYIAKNISKPPRNIVVLDAGDKPENVIDKAIEIRPSKTIIIDAADFGGTVGEIRLIPEDSIPDNTLTTHTFPLRIVARIIAEDTGSEVFFIGIQPRSMEFGEELSLEVKESADEIINILA
ncbi:MAG: hydrogenase maturation peptidase HycI [Thermodesulfovibrio sp.]|nr:hydrogenase maturation peptidase HycI [Thermodesulfovibrio sp.]